MKKLYENHFIRVEGSEEQGIIIKNKTDEEILILYENEEEAMENLVNSEYEVEPNSSIEVEPMEINYNDIIAWEEYGDLYRVFVKVKLF